MFKVGKDGIGVVFVEGEPVGKLCLDTRGHFDRGKSSCLGLFKFVNDPFRESLGRPFKVSGQMDFVRDLRDRTRGLPV